MKKRSLAVAVVFLFVIVATIWASRAMGYRHIVRGTVVAKTSRSIVVETKYRGVETDPGDDDFYVFNDGGKVLVKDEDGNPSSFSDLAEGSYVEAEWGSTGKSRAGGSLVPNEIRIQPS